VSDGSNCSECGRGFLNECAFIHAQGGSRGDFGFLIAGSEAIEQDFSSVSLEARICVRRRIAEYMSWKRPRLVLEGLRVEDQVSALRVRDRANLPEKRRWARSAIGNSNGHRASYWNPCGVTTSQRGYGRADIRCCRRCH